MEENPGLMGFFACARKEYKGNAARLLLSWETPGFDFQKAFEEVKGLDLTLNLYKKGVNGIYAIVETEVCISAIS